MTYSNGSSSPPDLGKMTTQDCVKRLAELRASTGDTTSEQASVTARLEALKQAARAKASPTAPLPVPPPVGSHNPFGFPAWDADLTNRGDDALGNADGARDGSVRGHEPFGTHPTGGSSSAFTPPTPTAESAAERYRRLATLVLTDLRDRANGLTPTWPPAGSSEFGTVKTSKDALAQLLGEVKTDHPDIAAIIGPINKGFATQNKGTPGARRLNEAIAALAKLGGTTDDSGKK